MNGNSIEIRSSIDQLLKKKKKVNVKDYSYPWQV